MSLVNEYENTGNWLFKYRSYLPLLVIPPLLYWTANPNISDSYKTLLYFGLGVSYFGEFIRIFTVAYTPPGTSGRNTKQQLADSLNTTGIYSILRHPLYLGNFFMFLGTFIYTGDLNAVIIFILIYWLYYERIMFKEEAFLKGKFENEFLNWANKTPAIIPNFKNFIPSNASFSMQKVLEREYSGFCAVAVIFTFLIGFRNFSRSIEPTISDNWKILFFVNGLLYIFLRSLKKIRWYKANLR